MNELVKTFMAKPLHAIIIVLCVAAWSSHTELQLVKEAQATLVAEQVTDKQINKLVLKMNETVIRIDENLIHVKDDVSNLTNKLE